MERIRDYAGFVIWFLGFGYVAAWALAARDVAAMPLALHGVGLAAAASLPLRLWRFRQSRGKAESSSGPPPVSFRRSAVPRRPSVKPRSHFGLRMPPSLRR